MASSKQLLAKVQKTPSTKGIPEIEVTDNKIAEKIDEFVNNSSQIGILTEKNKFASALIKEFAEEVHAQFAQSGEFTKSIKLSGNSETVTFTKVDKFSVKSDLSEIKKEVPEFLEYFEEEVSLKVKSSVMKNPRKLKAFLTAAEEAGILEDFEVSQKVVTKSGFDKVIAEASPSVRTKMAKLAPQQSASLKIS